MHYEIVFKGDRCCSCYTCLPQSSPAAQTAQKIVVAPSTGTDAPPKDLTSTHEHMAKNKATT